jgi:hypothetical protein
MDKVITPNRWNPYVLINNDDSNSFFSNHFSESGRHTLFILSKGFDVRMNITLTRLLASCPNVNLDCLLVEFEEQPNSHSHKYKELVDENMEYLNTMIGKRQLKRKAIALHTKKGNKQKRIGDRSAAGMFENFTDFEGYSDIIVDISSLPRGIYFSLIGKILSLLEGQNNKINLFVSVAENAAIDQNIKEFGADDDLNYLFGFGGRIESNIR